MGSLNFLRIWVTRLAFWTNYALGVSNFVFLVWFWVFNHGSLYFKIFLDFFLFCLIGLILGSKHMSSLNFWRNWGIQLFFQQIRFLGFTEITKVIMYFVFWIDTCSGECEEDAKVIHVFCFLNNCLILFFPFGSWRVWIKMFLGLKREVFFFSQLILNL